MSTVIKASSHEEFERIRQELPAIGASELACLLGVSPWGTAFSVWADKVHGARRRSNEAMTWGRRLEDSVASFYAEEVGQAVTGTGLEIHVSDTHPYVSATPDRIRADGRLVEVKLSAERDDWGVDGTDDIPACYKAQVQQQMFVLDRDVVDVAVLLRGNEFHHYTVRRDEEFMAGALEIEHQFWHEHVLARIAPPLDYRHPSTAGVLKSLFKLAHGKIIDLTLLEDETLRQYLRLKHQAKCIEEDLEDYRNRILFLMGDAERAEGMLYRATRTAVHKEPHEVSGCDYFQLKVKEK